MSLDEGNEEETIHEEAELIKREQKPVAEEAEVEEEVTAKTEEEVAEYHPIKVELVEVLLDAIDILEKLAKGEIDPTEARAEYAERVELPSRQLVEEAKPAKSQVKASAKKKRKSQKSTQKGSAKKGRKRKSQSKAG